MVEVLAACPTNWGLSPVNAKRWLGEYAATIPTWRL